MTGVGGVQMEEAGELGSWREKGREKEQRKAMQKRKRRRERANEKTKQESPPVYGRHDRCSGSFEPQQGVWVSLTLPASCCSDHQMSTAEGQSAVASACACSAAPRGSKTLSPSSLTPVSPLRQPL